MAANTISRRNRVDDDFPLPEVKKEEGAFDPAAFFDDEEAAAASSAAPQEDPVFDPSRFFDDEQAEASFPAAPSDEEVPFAPPSDFAGQEDAPPTFFPEEEAAPPTIFPDEEEEWQPPTIFPDEEESGYSPAPVSPDRNEYYPDDGQMPVSDRSGETLFSRTGDQIKKVIGIIRGGATGWMHGKENDGTYNENVEIRYSDQNH